jgi:hypothetical protein
MSAPSSLLQETFEILPCCRYESFTGDSLQTPQTEAPQTMPIFGGSLQWLNPDPSCVHGFLVSKRLMIAFHSFEGVGVKRAMDLPTTLTGSTLGFARAGIARSCLGRVLHASRAWYSIREGSSGCP